MQKKHIAAAKHDYIWALARTLYPADRAVRDLTMYLEYLDEFHAINITSIDEQINKTSTELVPIEVEDGQTIMVSERDLAVDYYEESYYEESYLFSSFLMEGYIYKAHQQLGRILEMYCQVVETHSQKSFMNFRSNFKGIPELFIRGEYLKKYLLDQHDPKIKQSKLLNKQLEQISIVRNCLLHEEGHIKEKNFVNKVKSLFRTENCGRLDQQHKLPLIVLNKNYPPFLLRFITEYSTFMKPYLLKIIKEK